ncbi:MAG: TIGR03088 family PEP-CTERM/XrtA system glycosyltransferase [Magnetococcales bacterium]|nr:TIGR03088 family PEP-CTERM/XrtA system glycosyltransferase [Magnetococcales bacterium]
MKRIGDGARGASPRTPPGSSVPGPCQGDNPPGPLPVIRIVHLVYRLDIGGLETVVANLVNRLPSDRFTHAIVSLTELTDFQHRIVTPQVTFHALHKRPGQDWPVWIRFWKLLRQLRPDLVHACNLATLEAVIPTRLAGIRRFVHAEHGRDSHDPDGTKTTYLMWRRLLNPWVDRFVPVSRELEQWMLHTLRIPPRKIRLIVNGVTLPPPRPAPPTDPDRPFVIGTVGRLWPIKDPLNLVEAFHRLRQRLPDKKIQLLMVGDGPERPSVESLAARHQLTEQLHITGWQTEVAPFFDRMDLFVLPSKREGTPLTLLEAMAHGLPVVATRVGGIPELVRENHTGQLVAPGDPEALAVEMAGYLLDPDKTRRHGAAGRQRVAEHYAMERVVSSYQALFEGLLVTKNQDS